MQQDHVTRIYPPKRYRGQYYVTIDCCERTGLTKPECSCPSCTRQLLGQLHGVAA